MTRASKSIFVFGNYSLILRLVFLLIPNLILPIVALPVSNAPWIQLLGFVLVCSSYYYLSIASKSDNNFARYTTYTNFAAPVVVFVMIITGIANWHFLSFGIIDGLGGL